MSERQLLHIVIGGELADVGPHAHEFKDLKEVEFVGAYPDYASARDAWKSADRCAALRRRSTRWPNRHCQQCLTKSSRTLTSVTLLSSHICCLKERSIRRLAN
jgi:hypothetical protein